jgi:hypothetical protein
VSSNPTTGTIRKYAMINVWFTMPWGAEWKYDMPVVPCIGEHVDLNDRQFLVTQILYYPDMNRVRIGLEHL